MSERLRTLLSGKFLFLCVALIGLSQSVEARDTGYLAGRLDEDSLNVLRVKSEFLLLRLQNYVFLSHWFILIINESQKTLLFYNKPESTLSPQK